MIEKEIERLRKVSADSLAEVERLEKLQARFPDLMKLTDRHRWERLASGEVLKLATKAELRHSCGCCSDSMLKLYPYVDTELGKVYAYQGGYVVGEKSSYGDSPKSNWKDLLHEVHPDIVQMVAKHFADQKANALKSVEDSFQEHESMWDNEALL